MRPTRVLLVALDLLLLLAFARIAGDAFLPRDTPVTAGALRSDGSPSLPVVHGGAIEPATTPIPMPTDPSRESIVESARGHLARRLGVSPSEVSVVGVEPTKLPNGVPGCQVPGPDGVQWVEWGNLILLCYDEQVYEYRADVHGRLACCAPPRPLSEVQARAGTPAPPDE